MRIKTSVADLAILGGTPAFDSPVHVGQPNIGSEEGILARIQASLANRWLSNNGPNVQEFERRLESYLGVRNCVAVCNATAGLEIAIRALGLAGEVIVPAFTFVATPHSLQWQGISPVFCDIEPVDHNIDPARIEELITPKTTAILAVHLWGEPAQVGALDLIARRCGLKLIFDSAHAFACDHGDRMVGGFGDAEVFSFHATKFFNTFEGGAVATNDDELAARIRLMTNFGFSGYDTVVSLGTNGKMNEISAAMGLDGLEHVDGFIETNRMNRKRYRDSLDGIPGIRLMEHGVNGRRNHQYIVLEVSGADTGIDRDVLLSCLWAENVRARRYFHPGCHRMEPYRSIFPDVSSRLPVTERVASRVLVLPTGRSVDDASIDAICGVIRLATANPDVVRRGAADMAAAHLPPTALT